MLQRTIIEQLNFTEENPKRKLFRDVIFTEYII